MSTGLHNEQTLAIHGLPYLPWIGFFRKIAHANVFILLDDAKISNSSDFLKRAKYNHYGEIKWLTIPTVHSAHGPMIRHNVRISESRPWRTNHLDRLSQAYRRAPKYREIMPLADRIISFEETNLFKFNGHGLSCLLNYLDLHIPIRKSSEYFTEQLIATDRIIALCKKTSCQTYFSGTGALDYLDIDSLSAHGIRLVIDNYRCPPYPQISTFNYLSGLSILDVLFMLGKNLTLEIIHAEAP